MTEEAALYILEEYKPIIGFVMYRNALDVAIKALEKQVPKKINHCCCPVCGHYFEDYEHKKYCPECGQKMDSEV